jgi:hypothetical protein
MKTKKALAGPLGGALATLAAVGLAIAAGQTETYTVKKGDTLWEIAADKLGEGKRWPEVWEKNAHIKDPNRIYPGNLVALPVAAQPVAPTVTGMVSPPPPEPMPTDALAYTRAREAGYVSADEYEDAGHITGSNNASQNLYTGVEVFIDRGAREGVRVDDNFRIFRREVAIVHPETNQPAGYRIAEKGQLRVIQVMDHTSRCRIIRSYDVIIRGDLVTPYKPLPETITMNPAPRDVDGMILAGEADRIEFGREDLVYLDRGTRQGLDVGSRLAVYREGDGLSGYPKDRDLPPDVLGEAVVIRASDEGSTALLTRSKAPIHVGDHVASTARMNIPVQIGREISSDPAFGRAADRPSNEGVIRILGSGLRSSE